MKLENQDHDQVCDNHEERCIEKFQSRKRKWDLDDQGIIHKVESVESMEGTASMESMESMGGAASMKSIASGKRVARSESVTSANSNNHSHDDKSKHQDTDGTLPIAKTTRTIESESLAEKDEMISTTLTKDEEKALASAKEAAAKINALLEAKERTLQPTSSYIEDSHDTSRDSGFNRKITTEPASMVAAVASPKKQTLSHSERGEKSIAETLGLDEKDTSDQDKKTAMEGNLKQIVDVNDSRHRYYIVRSATIAEIETFSGASLTVKGKYYPDRNLATEKDPPLCVEVAATSGEVLQKAINRIMELKETGPPTPKPPSLLTVKVVAPFDPETCCPPGISIRQKILGPQGAFLKHIQRETGARINLRGKGSGHVEIGQKEEKLEPLYLMLQAERATDLERARQLSEDLLATVKLELEAATRATAAGSVMMSNVVGGGSNFVGGTMPIMSGVSYGYGGGMPIMSAPHMTTPHVMPSHTMMQYSSMMSPSLSTPLPMSSLPSNIPNSGQNMMTPMTGHIPATTLYGYPVAATTTFPNQTGSSQPIPYNHPATHPSSTTNPPNYLASTTTKNIPNS